MTPTVRILATAAALLAGGGASAAPPAEPAPAQPTPTLHFAFEEVVTLAKAIVPGATAYGARTIIPITGGTFAGPALHGTILPGGWDWQLRRADGCTDVKADYMLRTDDGTVINVVNRGAICPAAGGLAAVRTLPVFEAPLGKYQWLSQHAFVGTLTGATLPDGTPAVRIRFYRVD